MRTLKSRTVTVLLTVWISEVSEAAEERESGLNSKMKYKSMFLYRKEVKADQFKRILELLQDPSSLFTSWSEIVICLNSDQTCTKTEQV